MDASPKTSTRSAARQALLQKLAASHNPRRLSAEPVALVGLHCRFPGARDPQRFWQLLHRGEDAVGPWPRDRLGGKPPPGCPERGGFLEQVELFDADFFGISPREAQTMDPQHRLALEVAWHALEDAGLSREILAGSRTGVYAAVYQRDYARLALAQADQIDAYTASGTHHSVAANRLSYLLDLRGPSLTVDTACSSSLVAVQLACRALLNREIDRAVVLASNLMLDPGESISLERWDMLASDGRCKTFDAGADGFVRGEGCAAVVLERQREVQAAGRQARALILGAAVNQDGRSNGLTAPNGQAQQAVIREALQDAGIDPCRLSYVEAHGTGTPLGDPIEVEALAAALSSGEPHPGCLIGSVKTNIGHLEAAAGLAGLIKTVLALEHQQIPPSIHFTQLNPAITLESTPLAVATRLQPWPGHRQPRTAGVSAFGMGGTNAHVILTEAPLQACAHADPGEPPARAQLLVLSAPDPAALRQLAQAHRRRCGELTPDLQPDPATLAAAACRRTHHTHRLAVVAASAEQLGEALDDRLEQPLRPLQVNPGVVFVFSGQGSQWPGMAQQLMHSEPAFARTLERCEGELQALEGGSLRQLLEAPADDPRLQRIEVIQPLLLAMQLSLAALWRAWGLRPDAVVGHSMGEVAAACVAGALPLADAVRIIARRSRLMSRLRGSGAMLATSLSAQQAEAVVANHAQLSVAVINGPRDTVLSGDDEAIQHVKQQLEARGVRCRAVAVDVASHGPAVDQLAGELARELAGLRPRAARIPFYSTVLDQVLDGPELGPDYWVQNLRRPVRFGDAARRLRQDGHGVFVEISPHPILLPALGHHRGALLVGSGQRDGDSRRALLRGLGQLHERGCQVDLTALYPVDPGRVALPHHPFQRQRHWLPETPRAHSAAAARVRGAGLLGEPLDLAHDPGRSCFALTLDPQSLPFVDDHAVEGERVLPGTGSVEIVTAAARQLWPGRVCALTQVVFQRPILLPPGQRMELQLSFSGRDFRLAGRHGEGWTGLLRGQVQPDHAALPGLDRQALLARCPDEQPGSRLYARLNATGNHWGPAFQGVQRLWRGDNELLAHITPPAAIVDQLHHFVFHPALLDACGQALIELTAEPGPFVLATLERVTTFKTPSGPLWAHVKGDGVKKLKELRAKNEAAEPLEGLGAGELAGRGAGDSVTPTGSLTGDVDIYDDHGDPVAQMRGLCIRFVHHDGTARRSAEHPDNWLHEVVWRPQPDRDRVEPAKPDSVWIAGVDPHQELDAVCAALRSSGIEPLRFSASEPLPEDQHGSRDLLLCSLDPLPQDGDAGVVATRVLEACWSAVRRCRELCRRGGRLWIVTRGAVATSPADSAEPHQASLRGLGQIIAAEHPASFGGMLDLDPAGSLEQAAAELPAVLADHDPWTRLALRRGQRLQPRLRRLDPAPLDLACAPPETSLAATLRPDASYLITGGLGGLGLHVARRLVQRGARRLLLLGRTPLPPREQWRSPRDPAQAATIRALLQLEALGAHLQLVPGDVGDPAVMAALARRWREQQYPPLRGVVHAAGTQHPCDVASMHRDQLHQELQAKVAGTLALWQALGPQLDFLVLFSSTATLLDSPMLGGYSAANAFLDAFARRQHAAGYPVRAINWGVWREAGMAHRYTEATGRRLEGGGVGSMSPEQGLDALERVMTLPQPQVAVMPMDWQRWQADHPGAAQTPYLEQLPGPQAASAGSETPSTLLQGLEQLDPPERQQRLQDYLRRRLGRILRLGAGELPMDRPLTRLGLDSLMALELRNRVEADTGVALAVVFILQCRSVQQLLERLDAGLAAATSTDEDWEELTI